MTSDTTDDVCVGRHPTEPEGLPRWFCTETADHEGDHVARGCDDRLIARWPQ